MRRVLLLLALASCGPKAAPKTATFDEDLPKTTAVTAEAPAPAVDAPRPVAPSGKGLRNGTIARDKLVAVLDKGPGMFLQQLEITPRLNGERFVGWQLVQLLDHAG